MAFPLLKKILPARTRFQIRKWYWQLRGVWYRGSKVYCPLCQTSFSGFLPFGKPLRQNAMCPRCNTVERHRLLWLYLKNELKVETRPYRILHMAPEPVIQDKLRSLPHLTYLSADLNSAAAMQHVDIQDLPFADASFNLILCSHVLAHVPDDVQGLRELRRVLQPGGQLLLQSNVTEELAVTEEFPDSFTAKQRDELYGQPDRCRNYGQDHNTRIENQGFQVTTVDYAPLSSPEEYARLGLQYLERLYVATPTPLTHAG